MNRCYNCDSTEGVVEICGACEAVTFEEFRRDGRQSVRGLVADLHYALEIQMRIRDNDWRSNEERIEDIKAKVIIRKAAEWLDESA
jgi:hypothetical protein